ncbi:MAG: ATP-binding protein [Saprospiraceae bacterium]|nr:ATP-binding protein [Saprospiraceae bacterium]
MEFSYYYDQHYGIRKSLSRNLFNGLNPLGMVYVSIHLVNAISSKSPFAVYFLVMGLLLLSYSFYLNAYKDNQEGSIQLTGSFFILFFTLKPLFIGQDSSLPFGYLFLFIFFVIGLYRRRILFFYLIVLTSSAIFYLIYYTTYTPPSVGNNGDLLNKIYFVLTFLILGWAFWIYRQHNLKLLAYVQNNDELLQNIVNNNPNLILFVNSSGNILLLNQAAQHFLNVSYHYFQGKPIGKFSPQLQEILHAYKQSDNYRNKITFTQNNVLIIDHEQKERWFNFTFKSQSHNHSLQSDILIIAADITEQVKKQLEVLKISNNRFNTLFDSSPLGIAVFDFERGRFVNANAELLALMECDVHELQFIEWHHLISSRIDSDALASLSDQVIAGKSNSVQFKTEVKSTKGKYFWANINFSKFGFSDAPLYLMFIENITEQETAKHQLEESEERYRTIFESAFDGIIIYDLNKKAPINCNDKILDLLQFESKEPFLANFHNIFSKSCTHYKTFWSDRPDSMLSKVQMKGKDKTECLFVKQDESEIPVETTLVQLPHQSHLFVMIVKDLSDTKKKESIIQKKVAALRKKNRELKKYIESNKELEKFAFIVAHDLKSPLRTMTSFAQLLQRKANEKLNHKEEQFLNQILIAADNMSRFIDGLLTYGKVNNQALEILPIQPIRIIEKTVNALESLIREKKASISYENLGYKILADPFKLQQLYQNLIQNALKYNKEGVAPEIQISAKDNPMEWEFVVKDNGIGISTEMKDNIFALFYKHHPLDNQQGTGIGLSVCKKIVEQHKGRIWVESIEGIGSEFHFTITKDL